MPIHKSHSQSHAALSAKLMMGSALAGFALFSGSAALAQNESVTITGTSIRGTAPVGSNIISVDRTSIEESGAVTIAELMTNIPQITGASGGFGSSGQRNEGGGGGFSSPNIHSLGTQASTATLVLIDGHVIPPVGNATLVVDPSVIPSAALQRVEVLPDGASAIYGANAVAGVINYITRRDYSGFETRVAGGVGDHYNTFSASQLFGHTWDTGSVMAVYSYTNRTNLDSRWRKFQTTRQDIRMGGLTPEQAAQFTFPTTNPPAGIPTTLVAGGVAVSGADNYRGAAIPARSIGSNFQNFSCPVAAISSSQTGNAFLYPYAAGGINTVTVTNGSGGTMTESGFRRSVTNGGTMGVCDQQDYANELFSDQATNLLVAIRQQLTDRISFNVDLVRGSKLTSTKSDRGSISAFAFNNAAGTTGGPAFGTNQRNPFYVGVPGAAPTANSQFVTMGFDELLGPGARNKVNVVNQFATLGLDVDLGGNWAMTLGATLGSSSHANANSGGVVAAQAHLALNGTTNANGTANNSGASSALADPYGLGTVVSVTRALTTANALDVWNPRETNRTSAAVLRSLTDSSTYSVAYSNLQDVTLKFDGPVIDPYGAGEIKVAVGANFNHYTQPQYLTTNNGAGPSSTSSRGRTFAFDRTSYAAFMEFLIPIVNQDMGIPGIQRLVLNMSGRFDQFSDFGETTNPKASLAWDILDGLSARGSYSTSFVAPNPHDVGGPQGINSQTQIQSTQITNQRIIPFLAVNPLPFSQDPFTARGVGTAGTFVETPAACTALNSVTGLAAGTATVVDINGNTSTIATPGTGAGQQYGCRLTTTGNAGFAGLQLGGAKGDLKPQRGLTYSAGLDIDAGQLWEILEGFTASITYYNTKFMDVITNQQVQANIPEATSFGPAVSAGNPLGGWSSTDPNIVALIGSRPLAGVLPPRIYTIVDNRIQNPFTIWQSGFDIELNYRFETESWGAFTLSLNGNEVIRFAQKPNSVTGVVLDVNNCTNNARYCTSEFNGSARIGWRYESITAGLTFNYTHPYWSPNNTFPWSLPGPNRPAGFQHVGSLQTFDMNVGYTLPEEWLSGTSVNLTINNLLDKPPPFFDNAAGFTNGSQIGRTVNLSMTKKW